MNAAGAMELALQDLDAVSHDKMGFKEQYNFYNRSADCFARAALMPGGASAGSMVAAVNQRASI